MAVEFAASIEAEYQKLLNGKPFRSTPPIQIGRLDEQTVDAINKYHPTSNYETIIYHNERAHDSHLKSRYWRALQSASRQLLAAVGINQNSYVNPFRYQIVAGDYSTGKSNDELGLHFDRTGRLHDPPFHPVGNFQCVIGTPLTLVGDGLFQYLGESQAPNSPIFEMVDGSITAVEAGVIHYFPPLCMHGAPPIPEQRSLRTMLRYWPDL